ncbi:(d)CMP kinase [Candidatus Liberibacter sp.]|uniref:(d)CMP kinase n=1 Tax=Candidatus Liberibacter sp. TaxID=34022 RepID=UPI0015F46191|nr:(d)CMP kinase [Candidatus Liberibacter sp.]MBA5723769.1 (d)CMP kinase [Candidatus Liberibacter sp.]
MSTVIAVDGTSAAGKGVLSRFIACEYGFHHLDTGLIYRAVAKNILEAGISLEDEFAAEKIARDVDLLALDKMNLSSQEISEAASEIAAIASVRRALMKIQRSFSQQEPGAVLDGRDIGTVICPDAIVKFYVTSSLNVRAQRRYSEMISNGEKVDYAAILDSIRKRDGRDKNRFFCPLVQSKDAILLDTSAMSIDIMCKVAKGLIDTKLCRG